MSYTPADHGQPLSPQEHEILIAVAHGLTDKQIAARLYLSHATVKTHLGRMSIKLGASNRTNMVTIAFLTGVLTKVMFAAEVGVR